MIRTLSLFGAYALARAGDLITETAISLAEFSLGEDSVCHVGDGDIAIWEQCERCSGKKFHGSAENEHDRDWCAECGGLGEVHRNMNWNEIRSQLAADTKAWRDWATRIGGS